eukprot:2952452-Amphidinium_carterae.1
MLLRQLALALLLHCVVEAVQPLFWLNGIKGAFPWCLTFAAIWPNGLGPVHRAFEPKPRSETSSMTPASLNYGRRNSSREA